MKNYVIDGGFLLHYVVRQLNCTSEDICHTYCKYIVKSDKGAISVEFDSYPGTSLEG